MGCHISLMLKGELINYLQPHSPNLQNGLENIKSQNIDCVCHPFPLELKTFVIHVGTSEMQWSKNITTNKLQLFSHGFLWRSVGSCGSPGGRDLCTGGCIGSLHICSATTAQKKSTTRTEKDSERLTSWGDGFRKVRAFNKCSFNALLDRRTCCFERKFNLRSRGYTVWACMSSMKLLVPSI